MPRGPFVRRPDLLETTLVLGVIVIFAWTCAARVDAPRELDPLRAQYRAGSLL